MIIKSQGVLLDAIHENGKAIPVFGLDPLLLSSTIAPIDRPAPERRS